MEEKINKMEDFYLAGEITQNKAIKIKRLKFFKKELKTQGEQRKSKIYLVRILEQSGKFNQKKVMQP